MYTSARAAIWNALTALAIIAILFVTFYGLTQRDPSGTAGPGPTAVAPTPAQTTGQGGSQNEAAPKGEGAH